MLLIAQVQGVEFLGQGGHEIVVTVFKGLINYIATLLIESRALSKRRLESEFGNARSDGVVITYRLAILQPLLVVIHLNLTEFPSNNVRACCGDDFLFDHTRARVRTVVEASRSEIDVLNVELLQIIFGNA